MQFPGTNPRLWWGGLLLWLLALVAASPFDLALSRAAARPEHPFAVFIRFQGTHPSTALYVVAGLWLLLPFWRRRSRLLTALAAAIAVHGLLHPLLITHTIKLLWGRLRYYQLPPDAADFTPFWLPTPGSGGRSFPSGHVATAVVCWPAVFVLHRAGRRRAALLLGAVTAVWGLVVAWGRIVHGAHYLTDVTFSLGFSPLFAPISLQLGDALARRLAPRRAAHRT